jgi:hypothetical protein
MHKKANCHENQKSPQILDNLWKPRTFTALRRVISRSGNKSFLFRYLNKVFYAFLNTFDLLEPELIAQCILQKYGI